MLNENVCPVRVPGVKARVEEFGKLLVSPGLPMLCINKDAETIWDLCDGTHTVAQILEACGTAASDTAVKEQVVAFVEEAIRLGLMTVGNDRPPH